MYTTKDHYTIFDYFWPIFRNWDRSVIVKYSTLQQLSKPRWGIVTIEEKLPKEEEPN